MTPLFCSWSGVKSGACFSRVQLEQPAFYTRDFFPSTMRVRVRFRIFELNEGEQNMMHRGTPTAT